MTTIQPTHFAAQEYQSTLFLRDFPGAGVGDAVPSLTSFLKVQILSGATATLHGSNLPSDDSSWVLLGQATGLDSAVIYTPFSHFRVTMGAAGVVAVSAPESGASGGTSGSSATSPTDQVTDSGGTLFSPGSCGHTYSYDGQGNLLTDTATLGTAVRRKTYTWTSGNLSAESAWVVQ